MDPEIGLGPVVGEHHSLVSAQCLRVDALVEAGLEEGGGLF